jgi:hypothetical protein
MSTNSDIQVVYDSGRLPVWFRIPCFLIGLFCCVLTLDLIGTWLFGRSLLWATPWETPLGWFPAVAGTALLAFWFLSIWAARNRVLWDMGSWQLIHEGHWLFGTTRIYRSQANLVSVLIRFNRSLFSASWDVYVRDTSGVLHWLTGQQTEAYARAVAERIAAAIERPFEAA